MSLHDALANPHAYERWAETYPPAPHNPLMRAEQAAMLELWPAEARGCALDLACGSGRYAQLLAAKGAASVVALDFSEAMLRQARCDARVHASMMRLPFADAAFDIVVCGLAVGHAPQLKSWMSEVARVLREGGVLLYSDFHPAAAAAGMTRSFTDAQHCKYTLRHRRSELAAHRAAAVAAALVVETTFEVRAGEELCEPFAGSEDFYRRWQGLPLVLVVRARKLSTCPAAA